MLDKKFSHVSNMTQYMKVVVEILADLPRGKMLDAPAGSGAVVDAGRNLGFDAVGADINCERADFVYADFNQPLPFPTSEFQVVTCLEGIEHVFYQRNLLKELSRVLAPHGTIIISTPNTANFYSRLKFLFTGTFGQFWPHEMREPTSEKVDLGHISPISPVELVYAAHSFNLQVTSMHFDRHKRLIYLPLYLLCFPFMTYAVMRLMGYQRKAKNAFNPNINLWRLLMSWNGMWSRSLILEFKKLPE